MTFCQYSTATEDIERQLRSNIGAGSLLGERYAYNRKLSFFLMCEEQALNANIKSRDCNKMAVRLEVFEQITHVL